MIPTLPRRERRRRRFRRIVYGICLLVLGWAVGFLIFAQAVPDQAPPPDATTDAIVVLTGGSGRLDAGLMLLEKGLAKKLFVSGVHRGVDVRQILSVSQRRPQSVECCIALGYDADDTRGNAAETANWLDKEGYRSIRLVTASYHMPRSMIEFGAVMPDIEIIAHPVFPQSFKGEDWWLWPGSAALLLGEYNKFLLAAVRRGIVDPLFG